MASFNFRGFDGDNAEKSSEPVPRAPVSIQPTVITQETVMGNENNPNFQDKKIKVENVIKQISDLTKQVEKLKQQVSVDEKNQTSSPIQPIKKLSFVSESPFVLLPYLRSVQIPGGGFVSVGSRNWLLFLDNMRARGFSIDYINEFLLVSAWVVWTDLNHDVVEFQDANGSKARFTISSFQTVDAFRDRVNLWKMTNVGNSFINHVEQFCVWYPEESRQEERLRNGYSFLIRSIKQQTTSSAFLAKEKDGKLICPPENPVSFNVDGMVIPNILQNFSDMKKTWIRYENDSAAQVMECVPPPDMKYSWIPIEYRQILEEKYQITHHYYCQSSTFKDYLYSLKDPGKKPYIDSDGKPYLLTQSSNGKGYKVYLAQIMLSTPPFPNRTEVGEGKQTLREFLGMKMSDPEYYPLVQVILNAPPPPTDSPLYRIYSGAGYFYKIGSIIRMSSDAPLKAFRHSLLETYVKNKILPQEEAQTCLQRFADAVYRDCKAGVGQKMLSSDIIPPSYQDVLEQLFNYGNEQFECDSFKPISTLSKFNEPSKIQVGDLNSMSDKELDNLVQKLTRMNMK